jgi:uncharacterized protein with PIN domain
VRIQLRHFDHVIEGDVIKNGEKVCRKCGRPLTESSVEVVLVGSAGAYPYVLMACGACHSYYWQTRESEARDENS